MADVTVRELLKINGADLDAVGDVEIGAPAQEIREGLMAMVTAATISSGHPGGVPSVEVTIRLEDFRD